MPSIAFLHPDLGIGGAERLIVDCALALKNKGHSVTIFTSHHDKNHCFMETKNGQIDVITAGEWIPRSMIGKFKAFWAYIRMIYLTIYFLLNFKYDLVICDQISVGIFFLKLFKQKCIFYCHFPDQLLTKRESIFKKMYRFPIDSLEEITTGLANVILVNSFFTDEIFHKTFKTLKNVQTQVLYPTVNFKALDNEVSDHLDLNLNKAKIMFLSINRFERKKNIGLAIKSLKFLFDENNLNEKKLRISVHLIIAGGYDSINEENIQHFEELQQLARHLEIEEHITFLKSPTDGQKQILLRKCTAVIYTPENEHFGIVPLEAMYMKKPVIAVNSGGPKETVIDNETGFLCEPNPDAFSEAMNIFFKNENLSEEMGVKGHNHVISKFHYKNFEMQINKIVTNLLNGSLK